MSEAKDKAIFYGGALLVGLATVVGGLYLKNKVLYKPPSKELILKITKALRKPLQQTLQGVIETYDRVRTQLTPDQYREMVEAQEGMNIKTVIAQHTESVAKQNGLDAINYEKGLAYYANDTELRKLKAVLEKDYQLALTGILNQQLFGDLPIIPNDKLLQIYKKVTQAQYLNSVEVSKLMMGKTEQQMMNDPRLMQQIQNFQNKQKEQILTKNGITSTTDSVTQVYSILIKNAEKKDQAFRIKVKNIEAAYQQILQKYMTMIRQNPSPQVFDRLEDELLYMQV